MFVTPYANARQLIAWVLGLGEHARILEPAGARRGAARARGAADRAPQRRARVAAPRSGAGARRIRGADRIEPDPDGNGHHPDAAIRPERFARLVTLASILIDAGRAGRRIDARELRKG